MHRIARKVLLASLFSLLSVATTVWGAQLQDTLRLGGNGESPDLPIEFQSKLVPVSGGNGATVELRITAKIPPKHYTYSTAPNNGTGTQIKLSSIQGLEPVDKAFVADHAPKIVTELGFENKEVKYEKYVDQVTWIQKFRIQGGDAGQPLSISGSIKYQVCNERTCRRPTPHEFTAVLAESVSAPAVEENATSPESPKAAAKSEPAVPALATTTFEHFVGRKANPALAATWKVSIEPSQARPGDIVTIQVETDLKDAWHVYALDQGKTADGAGPIATGIKFESAGRLDPVTPQFGGPKPIEKASEAWEGLQERFHEGHVVWTRRFKVPDTAPLGNLPVSGGVAYQMCNQLGCQPPTGFSFGGNLLIADTAIAEAASLAVLGKLSAALATELVDEVAPPPIANAPAGEAVAVVAAGIDKSQGLGWFLIAAFGAGFAALLTPCVFPMIPITVSFFLKQSEKQHHRPITMASVYCLGIMATFTGLGLLVSILFGATKMNEWANNGWMNIGIAAVLVFFGLNLLGLFEIRIPSWLLTFSSGQESRGGFIGVLFMALTFTLTSFTCTFAFAGFLLAQATKGDRLWPVLGLLAFSLAFSLPFFFLALFPSVLKKLPKSGGWMNNVKVVMGLLEIGASFKFFSVADLAWHPEAWIFDYELVVSAWMVISITAGMYLMGMFRLAHDTAADYIGSLRLVFAMTFLGLAGYLGVGLFAPQKPGGKLWAYIDAFATPRFEGGDGPSGPYLEHGGLKYALDFERALKYAVEQNQPVFLDFTGMNCANCRFMEHGPMSTEEVKAKLNRFVRVQLFTDNVPRIPTEEAKRLVEHNRRIQEHWFGDVTLPAYVVIPPDPAILKAPEKILATYVGKEARDGEFSSFLDQAINRWTTLQANGGKGHLLGKR